MSNFTANLLETIKQKETQGNYDIFAGDKPTANRNLTNKTLSQIIAMQGNKAAGAYQFKPQTLKTLIKDLGLTGKEKFTPAFQDVLATRLLERRGLNDYLSGDLSPERFGNRVAMEWASLPVLTQMAGHRQPVEPGMSYYQGYGSNRALLSGSEYDKYKQMYGIGPTPQEQPAKSLVQTATDYLSDVFWNPKKLFGSSTD